MGQTAVALAVGGPVSSLPSNQTVFSTDAPYGKPGASPLTGVEG